jgi:hypothetical protein
MMSAYIDGIRRVSMTTAKFIEYQITRNILRRREQHTQAASGWLADRLIMITAVTAGMLLLGSYLQELLWVVLAAAAVLTLGIRTP